MTAALQCLTLTVPRVFYINCVEPHPNSESMKYHRVNRFLPRYGAFA